MTTLHYVPRLELVGTARTLRLTGKAYLTVAATPCEQNAWEHRVNEWHAKRNAPAGWQTIDTSHD